MNRKTAAAVLALFIVLAAALGFLLINKGDGPVMGMLLTNRPIESTDAYSGAAETHGDGVYLVVSSAFNQFREEFSSSVPEGSDLYAAVHYAECPKGSEYSVKWIRSGNVIKEETGTLATGPEGVLSCLLDGTCVIRGTYTFQLNIGGGNDFEQTFSAN